MDKSLAGLIGAMGALVAAPAAHATIAPPQAVDAAMQADSYADLLKPIPNALAVLRASANFPAGVPRNAPAAQGRSPIVQVQDHHHHHHHHHHHNNSGY